MQKIIIKNFRQISYAEIEIKDFLFLIGEQASGKSTIAKLIYFFKSLKQDYFNLLYETNKRSLVELQKKLISNIQNKFAIYFGYTSRLNDDFCIQYIFSIEKEYKLTLFKKRSLQIQFDNEYWDFINKKTIALQKKIDSNNENRMNFILQEKAKNALIKKMTTEVNKIFFDEKETLFLPAGRNITVSYPEQFQLLFFGELKSALYSNNETNTIDINLIKEFISYSKFLVDYFNGVKDNIENTPFTQLIYNIISQILHGDYKNENGMEKIFYNEKEFVPLSMSSSGQQEVIRIIQDAIYILNEKQKASRIIEEPETHLFPKAQMMLVELLILVANKTNSQLIITTHSPYVQATFNNMLYYTKVIRMQPDKKKEIEEFFLTENLKTAANECMNISPEKFQAYALKANSNVYCKSILDDVTQLIGDNFIDEETENINNEFDFLYSII